MTTERMKSAAARFAVAAVLIAIGWYSHMWYHLKFELHSHRRVALKGFRFTSPLLDVELPEGLKVNSEPIPFKYKIRSYVEQQINNGRLTDASVYYRDLMDGPWFGINEKREFDPASMMKVAVMIAWLKRAESDPKILRRTYVYDGKQDMTATQDIKPSHTILPDKAYTVDELLTFMLNYSDNNATSVLYNKLSATEINAVLNGMDITNNPHDNLNSITVHGYSGFFRILYNASYLNREMSEKALALLSLNDFSQGMVAGVPKGIAVASKFGEHDFSTGGGSKQLHEFGIVYHPKGHYILGVMTEGRDFAVQADFIREISRMVYAEVGASQTIR